VKGEFRPNRPRRPASARDSRRLGAAPGDLGWGVGCAAGARVSLYAHPIHPSVTPASHERHSQRVGAHARGSAEGPNREPQQKGPGGILPRVLPWRDLLLSPAAGW